MLMRLCELTAPPPDPRCAPYYPHYGRHVAWYTCKEAERAVAEEVLDMLVATDPKDVRMYLAIHPMALKGEM